jgi:hypothetical protein
MKKPRKLVLNKSNIEGRNEKKKSIKQKQPKERTIIKSQKQNVLSPPELTCQTHKLGHEIRITL